MSKPAVAYYGVSTRDQSKSGLGIDAQRTAVARRPQLAARFAEIAGFDLVTYSD